MKRFYKLVSTAPQGGGHAVLLDGKPVKTPSGQTLLAPTPALANAIMAEWAAQDKAIEPDSMPLTQILTTAIDRIIPDRAVFNEQVLNYLDTDLVCYPADKEGDLAALQEMHWGDVRAWFAQKFGVTLLTTTSLAALTQPAAAHDAVTAVVKAMDHYRFAAFQLVVSITGSIVLALAFEDGARDAAAVFDAMHVEEDYKAKLYNEDFYGRAPHQEKREASERKDLQAAQLFLESL